MKKSKTGLGVYILAGAILFPLIGSQKLSEKFLTWGMPIFLATALIACYSYKKLKSKVHFVKNDTLKGIIVGVPLWFLSSMAAGFLTGILTGLTN